MPNCYFLPGFAGTELYSGSPPDSLEWVSYSALAFGQEPNMTLAADGSSPQGPCGLALTPQGPLPNYYGSPLGVFAGQLATSQWTLIPWGWDFRKDLLAAGNLLAAQITARESAGAPCVLVGHSAGGLVCRAAYAALEQAGNQDLVKRIITLGTPHYGSYAAMSLLIGQNSALLAVAAMSLLGTLLQSFIPAPPSLCQIATIQDLLQVIYTWPCVYELLPFLGSPDNATDPNRPKLYAAGNWQGLPLSQNWLTYASTVWDVAMAQPASVPPAWALTTMAGQGRNTLTQLSQPSQLGTQYATSATSAGDGLVTLPSALAGAAWQYISGASHADLPAYYIGTGQLVAEVLVNRNAGTPRPAGPVIDGSIPQTLAPIPFAQLLAPFGTGGGSTTLPDP